MALIKVAKSAIGSTLKDQWKETIRCETLDNDVLAVRKTTETGEISKGSIIVVEPGQCAAIIDNGKVIDATIEEGEYKFDASTTPSFFAGKLSETFKEIWTRFTYEGVSSQKQAVIYFNTKEIVDNVFGTAIPIPYQDWSHPLINEITNEISPIRLEVKCFGKYSFRISNPPYFMKNLSGMADVYTKENLVEQLRAEIIAILQNVMNELGNSNYKVPVLELPSQTDEILKIINERDLDEHLNERGLKIVNFVIESVTLTDESEAKIDEYEYSTNSTLQKGRMVDAYANAVENAAKNSHGVINGMMGIGVMNMASDNTIKDVANNAFKSNNDTWECPNCKKRASGNFCSECGYKKSEIISCPKCGEKIEKESKFCKNCGTKINE